MGPVTAAVTAHMFSAWALEADCLGSKFQLCHLLAVELAVGRLLNLGLNLLIYKAGIFKVPLLVSLH